MKKFSLFFLFTLLFSSNLFADGNYSSTFNLIFISEERYTVVLDGREYNIYDELYIDGISPGEHSLEIYREGYENERRYDGRRPIYKDYVYVPEGCDFIATFDRKHDLKIRNKSCYNNHGHCDNCYKPQDRCSCGKYTHKHDDEHNYYGNRLSESKLRELVGIINSKGFDETKQSICKEVVASYEVDGKQLKEIINTLSFESSKIEVAKYAIDQKYKIKDLYYIYDAFGFESSVQEVSDYAKTKGYNKF